MVHKGDEVREGGGKKKLEAVDILFFMSRLPTIYGCGVAGMMSQSSGSASACFKA